MLHAVSKLVWLLLQPSSLLMLAVLAGMAISTQPRWARAGRRLLTGGALGLLAAGLAPVSTWLILPLEERFPRLAVRSGDAFDGIIVLGGAEDGRISAARGELHLNEAAERVTAGASLAVKLPRARIVFTGGVAAVFRKEPPGAAAVAAFWREMGISTDRILFEDRSRNTYENAQFTRELVKPRPGERWLLVTSAAHMPRSIGLFRRAGFDVTAYPVDFRTAGAEDLLEPFGSVPAGLKRLDEAMREWIGLVVYWLLGRTSALWPAP